MDMDRVNHVNHVKKDEFTNVLSVRITKRKDGSAKCEAKEGTNDEDKGNGLL